jgi:hypothetical protein
VFEVPAIVLAFLTSSTPLRWDAIETHSKCSTDLARWQRTAGKPSGGGRDNASSGGTEEDDDDDE